MSEFPHLTPIFRAKPPIPNPEELPGLWRLRWGIPGGAFLDTYYTRLDQALGLWGCVSAVLGIALRARQ